VQQGETMLRQLERLAAAVYRLTGEDVIGITEKKKSAVPKSSGKSMGSAVTDAAKATMTAYGEKLAKRARVDMDVGKPE